MLEWKLSGTTLHLIGEIKISQAEELFLSLRQLPHELAFLEIDLSEVSQVDTAGLQLLLAFCRSRSGQAAACLINPAPVFMRALNLSGLNAQFQSYLA